MTMTRLPLSLLLAGLVGSALFAATAAFTPQEPEMPQPTAHHELLQKSVGDWEGTLTMHAPGIPPGPYKAKETVTAHGPFWVQADFRSDFAGMPYRGGGMAGYDPDEKKFITTWADNFGPYLSVMKGEIDEETGHQVMTWTARDQMGEMAPHRSVTERTDDSYKMTFYTSEQKIMVIEMHRVKKEKAGR